MKYFVTFLVLLAIFSDSIIRNTFPFYVNILLLALIVSVMFLSEFSIFNRTFEGQYIFRSHNKPINPFSFALPAIFTILYLTHDYEFDALLLLILLWSIPVVGLIMQQVYKFKNPITLVIKNDKLVLNRPKLIERELSDLVDIKYDRYSKHLKLYFKSKSKVSIYTKAYTSEDLKAILNLAIEHSEQDIAIPENFVIANATPQ